MKKIASIKYYFKAMRVHHYLKNFLVFAPLLFSGLVFEWQKFQSDVFGFFSFCFISSAIYIINDINDIDKDKMHPTKKNRPIASGKISKLNAWIFAIILILLSALLNFFTFNLNSTLLLLLYLLLNLAYSNGLKNIPLVDIAILVSGFLIRVMYGAIVSEIEISNWLYLTVIAMGLYLSLGKRRNELKQSEDIGNTRKVLRFYSENFLDKNMYMCLALANVFYALWSVDEKTLITHNGNYLIWTVPIVLFITMKYSLNVEGDSDGDPVEVLVHDKALLVLSVLYFIAMFLILYLQK